MQDARSSGSQQLDVTEKDFGLGLNDNTAERGTVTFHVMNEGPQDHEAIFLKLSPGKHVADFNKWATTGKMQGPPPAMPVDGMSGMAKGRTGIFTANLTPGTYALVCLVPDMKADESVAALKAHLAKHGFGDIEVNMTGGYDPNSTSADAPLIRAQVAFYRGKGIDPIILPRSAGSWPGYVFTGDPLHLAAGHFGMGHGSGAHAPDEYYVIESTNPNVQGIDGAVRSHVEYLYELAAIK